MPKKIEPTLPDNPWQMLGSRTVFKNDYFEIRLDDVIQPNGVRGTYSYLTGNPVVAIIALNAQGEVALVEQWRYVHHRRTLEAPAGRMENRDAGPLAAAQRELQEETGVVAETWIPLGESYAAHSEAPWHFFLAQNLLSGTPKPDSTEDITVCWLPLSAALAKLDTGKISNIASTIGLLRVDRYLQGLQRL